MLLALPVFISGRPSSECLIIIVYQDVSLLHIEGVKGIIVQVVVRHQGLSDIPLVPLAVREQTGDHQENPH